MNKKYLEEIPLLERQEKEDVFFSKEIKLSYSAINKLLFSPALYYKHYILEDREDKLDSHLIDGKLIHCLLLTPELFSDEFVISSDRLPSDSVVNVIRQVYEIHKNSFTGEDEKKYLELTLFDYSDIILEILQEINLYQSLADDKKADKEGNQLTGNQKRLNKVITDEAIEYWDFLKSSETKTLITQESYEFAKLVVQKVKNLGWLMELMGINQEDIESLNEIYLECPFNKYFGLKGFIDNLVFDKKNKVIRINDFKTTNKTLSKFVDAIELYNYWLQILMYSLLVTKNYLTLKEYKGWTFECRFIVIDSFMQIGVIKVSTNTTEKWFNDTIALLSDISVHFEKKDFSLPYNFKNNELEI